MLNGENKDHRQKPALVAWKFSDGGGDQWLIFLPLGNKFPH